MESEKNKKMEKKPEKKSNWLIPIVTTLVGVVVSVLVAWYQINLAEKQVQEAEKERAKSVKSELVQIVEEHIINKSPLDISRLSRLADFRSRGENLLISPTVSEIVENAEFNIVKSQYLEFNKKLEFKEVFNNIYADIYAPDKVEYKGALENSVNDILASINERNDKDASAKVIKLATDLSSKIEELQAKDKMRDSTSLSDFIKVFIDKPEIILFVTLSYGALLYILHLFRRRAGREAFFQSKYMDKFMDSNGKNKHEPYI